MKNLIKVITLSILFSFSLTLSFAQDGTISGNNAIQKLDNKQQAEKKIVDDKANKKRDKLERSISSVQKSRDKQTAKIENDYAQKSEALKIEAGLNPNLDVKKKQEKLDAKYLKDKLKVVKKDQELQSKFSKKNDAINASRNKELNTLGKKHQNQSAKLVKELGNSGAATTGNKKFKERLQKENNAQSADNAQLKNEYKKNKEVSKNKWGPLANQPGIDKETKKGYNDAQKSYDKAIKKVDKKQAAQEKKNKKIIKATDKSIKKKEKKATKAKAKQKKSGEKPKLRKRRKH